MRHVLKHRQIAHALGVENFHQFVLDQYHNGLSSHEIAETIKATTQIAITPRALQRIVASYKATRSVKVAFNNAIKRGRVVWAYKQNKIKRVRLSDKLRYMVLERDKSHCVMCGKSPANGAILEVDHIVPVCRGGLSTLQNLRTLCNGCNVGKRVGNSER